MIIRQTTTIVFEYPQDYLQEQEWCKTKGDGWIHKSTDTLCSVYENQISYAVGASVSVKTESSSEKPNNYEPKICDFCRYYNSNIPCGSTPSACKEADKFAEEFVDGLKKLKPKTEPQFTEKCPFDDSLPCEWVCTEYGKCKYKPKTEQTAREGE